MPRYVANTKLIAEEASYPEQGNKDPADWEIAEVTSWELRSLEDKINRGTVVVTDENKEELVSRLEDCRFRWPLSEVGTSSQQWSFNQTLEESDSDTEDDESEFEDARAIPLTNFVETFEELEQIYSGYDDSAERSRRIINLIKSGQLTIPPEMEKFQSNPVRRFISRANSTANQLALLVTGWSQLPPPAKSDRHLVVEELQPTVVTLSLEEANN